MSTSYQKLGLLQFASRRTKMTAVRKAGLVIFLISVFVLPLANRTGSARFNLQTPTAKVAYVTIPSGEYKLDAAHSLIGFAIRHLEINWVEGRFNEFSGTIHYDEKDITKSSVEFTAKVESIDTGVAPRDKHLRSADFFEVEKYPELSFKSTRVERKGKAHVLYGDLTLKGVTKPVAIPFTMAGAIKDQRGNARFGVQGETKINRRDFGINFGTELPGGGLNIGNEVSIRLHLEALLPAAKPASE
jgi:polyisoprenoid-binding protein YceI